MPFSNLKLRDADGLFEPVEQYSDDFVHYSGVRFVSSLPRRYKQNLKTVKDRERVPQLDTTLLPEVIRGQKLGQVK